MSDIPHQRTPSNISKKRIPPPINTSTVSPGHVAQMQKLFQSAKASLRMDMAFAASPTGSIGSRLPPDKITPSHSPADVAQKEENLVKDWRYSIAPKVVAASELDVREPVPHGSPTLPDMSCLRDGTTSEPAVEPLSSGFNSPIDTTAAHVHFVSGIAPAGAHSGGAQDVCEADLRKNMTGLRVGSEEDDGEMDVDESPIIRRLKRISAADSPSIVQQAESADKEIFLSEPAEAAAESAKAKRSLLRRLFPRKDHGSSSEVETRSASPVDKASDDSPCPDPSLHRLMSMGVCPEPAAHWRLPPPGLSTTPLGFTPETAQTLAQHTPSDGTCLPHTFPFHRATSTGSPMPFVRPHTATPSPGPYFDAQRQSYYGSPFPPHAGAQRPLRPHTRNGHPGTASEHFQPGWYYAQEAEHPQESLNPMTYSFSTAAAKVVGQSAAPESRIRDSYRTDTLTPLAKPASRYRKTGIAALANTRGVSKYYDGPDRKNSRATRPGTSRSRRDHVQFCSSPPRASEYMGSANQKHRRPRELEDEQFDIHEDDTAESTSNVQSNRAGEGGEPIEVDENTRAAVRMSLYGPETPEALQGEREGIKELSPNDTSWRKGMRLPRRKRRPSYWDGDLKQVRDSPAGRHDQVRSLQPGAERHVKTSPAKEDVESMRVSVRESVIQGNADVDMENVNTVQDEQEQTDGISVGNDESDEVVEKMDVDAVA